MGCIQQLERSATPYAVINPSRAGQHECGTVAINPASPCQMPGGIVLLRPLLLQQGFGLPVIQLLPPICPDGISAMMPHQCRGTETDRGAGCLKAPAEIHVVSGNPEPRIPAIHSQESITPEGCIAAGNVLRLGVGQ